MDPMAALEAASELIRAPRPMVALEAHGSPFDFFEAFQRARPAQPPTRSTVSAVRSMDPLACLPDPAIGRDSEEAGKQPTQLSESGRRLLSNSLPSGLSVPPRKKLPGSVMQASTKWTALDEECACPVCNQPFTSIGARASHLKGKNDAEHVAFRARPTRTWRSDHNMQGVQASFSSDTLAGEAAVLAAPYQIKEQYSHWQTKKVTKATKWDRSHFELDLAPLGTESETDPRKLEQRQKQISFGKNSLAYQRYLEKVPIKKRRFDLINSDHPRTPNIARDVSKRTFDGQLKAWRRQLHLWDPPGVVGALVPAPSAAAPGAEVGSEPAAAPPASGFDDFLGIDEDEDEDVAMTTGGPQEDRTSLAAWMARSRNGDLLHSGLLEEDDEARQSELSAEESIDRMVQGDAGRQTTMAEAGMQEDGGVESESNDGDDCGQQPTAPAAPADGAAFDEWLSRHGGRHVSQPRPSDKDAGGGLAFTNGPAAPLLAPASLVAHPNATEEQLREMIKDREDTSRALMLEIRASEDCRLAAEAAWSRAEAELVRWQRGELRLVPEVTDVETGQVSSTVVTETDEQRRGLKRPCEPTALAHIIETSQKTVKIKQEVVEQRAVAADAKGRLEDQLACVVCMEQPRSVVLRPCNHYVCCSVCASQQTHCPSAGCSVLVTSRLQGICMAPHQQAFEMGTGPPE